MSKSVYNLVPDIYDLVKTKETPDGVDLVAGLDDFGESVGAWMGEEVGGG